MSSTATTIPRKAPEAGSAGGNFTLRVVGSVPEFEGLREIWESWQEHPSSVMDTFLACFRGDTAAYQPHVMVVCRDGHPDCLLLGKRLHGVATSAVNRLLPSARVLYFIQGGLLGNPSIENCEFLLRAIIAALRRGEADAAEFFGLRVGAPLYQAAIQVPNFFCRDRFPTKIAHRCLLLPDSLQDFLAALPAKERQNLNYRQKRLLKKFPGKVRLRRFRGEDDVERLIDDAEQIAKNTYQRALGRGFTLAEGAGLRAEARQGSLRGYVLYIEEKPCAFLIASWRKGILYGTFGGHDPEYGEYSPGRYLLMRCIEDCFLYSGGEKTVIVDPGEGDQPYKRLVTNVEWQDAHVTIHAPTFKGFARNVARTSLCFAAHCTKGVLVKVDLLSLMRRTRRNRVVRKRGQSVRPSLHSHDQPD